MHQPTPDIRPEHPAPCQGARRLLAIVVIAVAVLILLAAGDIGLRRSGPAEPARHWMKALNLSAPALWTAGSPLRHAETTHPGVDPRYAPGLETTP